MRSASERMVHGRHLDGGVQGGGDVRTADVELDRFVPAGRTACAGSALSR